MPLTDIEREIIKSVVANFVDGRQSTHRSILLGFEQPRAIEHLSSLRILDVQENRTVFLPTVLAFHYCGVPTFLQIAKSSIDAVARALLGLFRAGNLDITRTYTPDDLSVHASGVNFVAFPNQISLGLFLVREFGVLQGFSTNPEHTKVTKFQISEDILTFKNTGREWDEFVKQRSEQIEGVVQPLKVEGMTSVQSDSRKIFLVHGHDEAVKHSVARFLEKLGFQPIILHEQPNRGQTLIEKFEANSDVGFAVVLLTPDDVGRVVSDKKLNPRARQNVILELGYFLAKLGRPRVCALYKNMVELPSDVDGVIYIAYDDSGGWRVKLANEIRAAGISVDMNQV